MPADKKKKEDSLYGPEGQKMAEGIAAVFGGPDKTEEDKQKEDTKKASTYLTRANKASSYLSK
ncbi:MAG TPA: hypothetical protein P5523_04795 [Bacteroidales bacterium]|nr:hypothetical protein [Bacteroidales bacterium]